MSRKSKFSSAIAVINTPEKIDSPQEIISVIIDDNTIKNTIRKSKFSSAIEDVKVDKKSERNFPKLNDWKITEEDEFFYQFGDNVIAKYDRILDFRKDQFCTYKILSKHYVTKLQDILKHINYFIKFYDVEHEYLVAMLSLKYMTDTTEDDMTPKAFTDYILKRVITKTFINRIRDMVDDLYECNIDTEMSENYRTTPKITNDQAKVIVALSFVTRLILPICVHYTNISHYFTTRKAYIPLFDKIYMSILSRLEKDYETQVFQSLCKFIEYRIDKNTMRDIGNWEKKRQLHSTNVELYKNTLIHEVILVKCIYKIDYSRSIVSYFDGVVMNNYSQYKKENFKSKPIEIAAEEYEKDDDDFLSHAEAIEMSIYKNDETNAFISEYNLADVYESLHYRFNIPINDKEFKFYYDNVKINSVSQQLLHSFYSRFFNDSTAIELVTREQAIWLLIILKKFLTLKGMVILPQICTAIVKGKFKENTIKNRRFNEKLETSSVFINSIKEKFKYVDEALNGKDSTIKRRLSTIINSSFTLVDFNPEIDGKIVEEIDEDMLIYEFSTFLSII